MDYSKLLGRIKEYGFTQKYVAKRIGVSESHFSLKLSGLYAFKQNEIREMCKLLDIPAEKIGVYFFTPEVGKTELNDMRK